MQIIKSALYIDFDNMAIPLDKVGETEIVMSNFENLLSFLSETGIQENIYGTKDGIRLFQKKVVFYNPRSFGKFEFMFKEFGFLTIPCPVVTTLNKTSTDMWLAVEMMKDVYTKQFDDYVLISADVDFAPVLLYINSCGKRTVQLGISRQNKIIQGAATISLQYEDFKNTLDKKISDVYDSSRDINTNVLVKNVQLPASFKPKEVREEKTPNIEKPSFTQARIISVPDIEKEEEQANNKANSFPQETQNSSKELDKKDLTNEVENDINEVIETYLGIPIFSSELLKEIFVVYAGCKANGIQRRFVNNSVLNRLQRSFRSDLKKGNPEYDKVLSMLRFITTWLGNSPKVLTPENIASEVLRNYLASSEWKKASDEYQLDAAYIRKLFKEVI